MITFETSLVCTRTVFKPSFTSPGRSEMVVSSFGLKKAEIENEHERFNSPI